MKKIIQRVGVLTLGALILTGSSMTAFAQDRSYTYNYDYWEDVQDSPDTYSVSGTFTYMDFGLDTNFKNPEGSYMSATVEITALWNLNGPPRIDWNCPEL